MLGANGLAFPGQSSLRRRPGAQQADDANAADGSIRTSRIQPSGTSAICCLASTQRDQQDLRFYGSVADQRLFRFVFLFSKVKDSQHPPMFSVSVTGNHSHFEDKLRLSTSSRILWTFADFSANGISTGHRSSVLCQGRPLTQPTQHLDAD